MVEFIKANFHFTPNQLNDYQHRTFTNIEQEGSSLKFKVGWMQNVETQTTSNDSINSALDGLVIASVSSDSTTFTYTYIKFPLKIERRYLCCWGRTQIKFCSLQSLATLTKSPVCVCVWKRVINCIKKKYAYTLNIKKFFDPEFPSFKLHVWADTHITYNQTQWNFLKERKTRKWNAFSIFFSF